MEYMEMVKNRSVFNSFLRMYVHGNILPAKSSNSGHLDWKACKIRVFRSFFLLRDTKMTLRKWLRTFITSKVDAVEIPVGLCYYLFGTTRMVGG